MNVIYIRNKNKTVLLLLVTKFLCQYCALFSIFLLNYFCCVQHYLFLFVSISKFLGGKYLHLLDVFNFQKRLRPLSWFRGWHPGEAVNNPRNYFHQLKNEVWNHSLYSPMPVHAVGIEMRTRKGVSSLMHLPTQSCLWSSCLYLPTWPTTISKKKKRWSRCSWSKRMLTTTGEVTFTFPPFSSSFEAC